MPEAPLPPLPPAGQPQWRTALDDLRGRLPGRPAPFLVVGLVTAVVLAGAVLLRARPPAGGAVVLPSAVPAPAEPAAAAGSSSKPTTVESEELVVDVAGAVARPGLVRLRPGARVAEAVASAAGPTADADLTSLNQARVLADGEQVRVPRVGEPALALPTPTGPAGAAGAARAGPSASIDINRASPTELESLPGVGPATAAAIITWRDENGGFRRVDDLLEVPGIGPARLERLRPLVRV